MRQQDEPEARISASGTIFPVVHIRAHNYLLNCVISHHAIQDLLLDIGFQLQSISLSNEEEMAEQTEKS